MSASPVVLYVEDDAMSREIMYLLLAEGMGLNVTIFEDSHDFAARVEQLHPMPDIILLDIHVPPLSGFEMLAYLRAHPTLAAVPVVALTASVMNEEVHKLKTAGFNGVIAKPIDVDTFPQLLERILAGEAIWRIVDL